MQEQEVLTVLFAISCLCLCLGQRCLREHVELAVLHPPHHHRLLLHAQPGVRCAVRVSKNCELSFSRGEIRIYQDLFDSQPDVFACDGCLCLRLNERRILFCLCSCRCSVCVTYGYMLCCVCYV